MEAAVGILDIHIWDQKYYDNKKKPKDQKLKSQGNEKETDVEEVNLNQKEKIEVCYCCGKEGHMSPDCEKIGKIAKVDWWINQIATQHIQKEEHDD